VSYTNLEANELDNHVLNFYEQYPDSGYQYCHGYLRKQNLRVRRADVHASMARVRPLATLRQDRHAIVRRTYTVKRSNAVWQVDGYHKLIRYGLVIHGFIDGYC
jgi:hypothetical protein